MARYLVLDWDHQYLQVVAATVKKGQVLLHQAAAWSEAVSPNPAVAEELGRQLRQRLQQAGIPPAPVLVCVGRDRVILKEIRHPPVAPAEEAAVVRFQAIKEMNGAPEEVVLDYTVLERTSPECRALTVLLRRELLATYQNLCRAAGLRLVGICPRSFGVAACVGSAGAEGTVAVLTATERWAEFCITRQGTLLLTRTFASPTGSEDALLAEIRRNLAIYSGQTPREPVRSLYVADGTEAGRLDERLRDKLAIPVHALDPLTGLAEPVARRGAAAGAVGLLHALAQQGTLPINFSKPRDVQPVGDPGKRRLALAAALVAALLLVGFALGYSEVSARDRQLQELVRTRTDLDRLLAQLKDDEKRLKVIGDWVNSEVVWLDELYDLTDRFPDPKQLRLTQMAVQPLTKAGSDKYVAHMMLKGITTESFEAIDRFMAQLGADRHYRVGAKEISPNIGVERAKFGQQFEAKLDLAPRPPSLYTRRLPPPPSEARKGFRKPVTAPGAVDAMPPQGDQP